MVALRVIVHTPYERVALSIPSTLYPSEATFFVQFLLQQHHSLDPVDTDSPQYVDVVSSSLWQLAHLTNGVLREDRSLYDNGIRDGDVLLSERDLTPEPVTASTITSGPQAVTEKERLNELQQTSRYMSLGTVALWVLGCVIAAAFPSWWSFGGVFGSLALLFAFTMLVIFRRGRDDAAFLGWSALIMAGAGGMALPGATFDLSWPTRILIAVSCIVVTLLLCHLVGTTSLKHESFAALLAVLILLMLGLTLIEYTRVPARSLAAGGMILAAILLLAAPRLALWMARVKIPLTALIDVDLPLLPPQTAIDAALNQKIQRARWLHAVLTLTGAFLSGICTVPLVGWPWSSPYAPPNPWQWILLALLVVSLLSTALHAVYRTQVGWILGTLLAITALVGLVLVVICLLIVSSLWLWATQWNLSPLAQKILEIIESVLLAIIFPIGIVATGLVSLLLTL